MSEEDAMYEQADQDERIDAMRAALANTREALLQAARIFELLKLGKPGFEQVTLADLINWLELPVVKAAVRSQQS
jgi:hypothetical protein